MMIKLGLKKFLHDETGQTTTEYILILAVVVTLIMQFKGRMVDVIRNLLGKVGQEADQAADVIQ